MFIYNSKFIYKELSPHHRLASNSDISQSLFTGGSLLDNSRIRLFFTLTTKKGHTITVGDNFQIACSMTLLAIR